MSLQITHFSQWIVLAVFAKRLHRVVANFCIPDHSATHIEIGGTYATLPITVIQSTVQYNSPNSCLPIGLTQSTLQHMHLCAASFMTMGIVK